MRCSGFFVAFTSQSCAQSYTESGIAPHYSWGRSSRTETNDPPQWYWLSSVQPGRIAAASSGLRRLALARSNSGWVKRSLPLPACVALGSVEQRLGEAVSTAAGVRGVRPPRIAAVNSSLRRLAFSSVEQRLGEAVSTAAGVRGVRPPRIAAVNSGLRRCWHSSTAATQRGTRYRSVLPVCPGFSALLCQENIRVSRYQPAAYDSGSSS